MEEILKKMAERWFLSEPALFALYCVQRVMPNSEMRCAVRCVKDGLEYNPVMLEDKSLMEIEQLMRLELIRLFLKHPYVRQPDNCSPESMALGSDCSLFGSYKPGTRNGLPITDPALFKLNVGEHYEWYVRKIEELFDGMGDKNTDESGRVGGLSQEAIDAAHDRASEWEEDSLKVAEINDLISNMKNWGTLPGDVVQQIIASTKARIDYKKILEGFRGSILSSHRKLTRMRPNRRLDFEQMGSMRKFNTRLLIAVDVSGSITDTTLANFYSVVNKFFRYGIDQIDVTQFDCRMTDVVSLRKAERRVNVLGRGGTSFQPVFDYMAEHPEYDGLVVLTDGFAPKPRIAESMKAKVLWVCEDEKFYDQHKDWMEEIGRVCWMYL